jgi:large conductance mechanosensitive channel
MDLAVGVIIGGAFGKIVDSLVNNILMPIVGVFMGGTDFTKMLTKLGSTAESPVLKYGSFIQSIIDFLIIAFCIFMMVKALNAARRRFEAAPKPVAPAAPPAPSNSEVYLKEIRDALAKR